jgi:hypothetical protein
MVGEGGGELKNDNMVYWKIVLHILSGDIPFHSFREITQHDLPSLKGISAHDLLLNVQQIS